jgi:pSer/pThr/pTyr-binding forkhead associated (FHA) protein
VGIDGPHLFRLDTGEEYPLAGTQVIGRNDSCNYVIRINTISGRHAAITLNGQMALLQDLGSTNGTYVREKRVDQAACLQDGDRFRLHNLEFEFRATRRADDWQDADRANADSTAVGRASAPRPLSLPAGWEAVREPTLYFVQGARSLGPLDGPRQTWMIGRGKDCSVRIADERVSQKHAKLVREGDTWKIMDQVSTNQTWVNERLVASAFLQSRDRLGFGPVACIFLLPRT